MGKQKLKELYERKYERIGHREEGFDTVYAVLAIVIFWLIFFTVIGAIQWA